MTGSPRTQPTRRTVIESIGIYLPPKNVPSDEIVRGCKARIRFPLERMTGIASRRMAGESEFSIDLAEKAISDCLRRSALDPGSIDLLVCANICRTDRPGFVVTYEPSTSIRLRHRFGFDSAVAFDIASACSGMFVAIHIVDALIQVGAVRSAMVVSGEYITHLARTAQLEIKGVLDPRLACLTLGDAGAAVTLRVSNEEGVGFQAIELDTLGRYAEHCVAAPTTEPHGGAIMLTDAIRLANVAVRYGSRHALRVTERAGWELDSFEHLIMHQTSRLTLRSARKEINRLVGGDVCREDNTIDNLAERGNTASTAHFVAVMDAIRAGRIRSGDRTIFAVSGSGQTIGTALYTFDGLPDRVRDPESFMPRRSSLPELARARQLAPSEPRVRIAACGIAHVAIEGTADSMQLLQEAALDAMERGGCPPGDVGLLVYTGVYRTDFIAEPAIAALLAGRLDMNATGRSTSGRRTLAFDVFNGGVGLLQACRFAGSLLAANHAKAALLVTADIENNAVEFPEHVVGLCQTGSAFLLERTNDEGPGFLSFRFRSFTEHLDARRSHLTNRDGKRYLAFEEDPGIEELYIEAIVETVEDFLSTEGLDAGQVDRIFPPRPSDTFAARLETALGVSSGTCVRHAADTGDLLTSSIPDAWRQARDEGLMEHGDMGLMISVGSGIQVGCALYRI